MDKILVAGAGFMGSGIAQVAAQAGYQVYLMDVQPSVLAKSLRDIHWSVEKFVTKGLLRESPGQVLERISTTDDLSIAAEVDIAIEAVPEVEETKQIVLQELDRITQTQTLLATNTSTIPITRLAAVTRHPERVLGLHFFSPVPLVPLVEVIKGEQTSLETIQRGISFVQSLGKTPLSVHCDVPGFVMNRIFSAAFREALNLVDQGIATPDEIDQGMRLGYGWSLGPFEIADLVGLDVVSRVGQNLASLGEPELAPRSNRIERMVAQGRLGRKAGIGFYNYSPDGKRLSPALGREDQNVASNTERKSSGSQNGTIR